VGKIIKRLRIGYTLLEVTIVVGIILIMMTLTTNMLNYSKKISRDTKRKIDLEQIKSALEFYRKNNNFIYPNDLDSLVGYYIKEIPKDPLNKSYHYSLDDSNANNFILATRLELGGPSQCGPCNNEVCNYCLTSYGIMLTPTPLAYITIIVTEQPTPTPTIVQDILCWSFLSQYRVGESVTVKGQWTNEIYEKYKDPNTQKLIVDWRIYESDCLPNIFRDGGNSIAGFSCSSVGTKTVEIRVRDSDPEVFNTCPLKIVE
jgi:general secretion pathway protein G